MDDHADDWWAPLAFSRPKVEVPLPLPGQPIRVAFVGQRTYFEVCSQEVPSRAIEPTFIDFRERG